MPLNIKTVNTKAADQTKPDPHHVKMASVTLDNNADHLDVVGEGHTAGVLHCTLVRFGRTDGKEPYESIWRSVQFINAIGGANWKAKVPLPSSVPAKYLLSCHTKADDTVYVEVINPAPAKKKDSDLDPGQLLKIVVSITSLSPSLLQINASGTIANAYNSITFTLTPIDCNSGASTGNSFVATLSMVPQNQVMIQTVTVTLGGPPYSVAASYTDAYDWQVTFFSQSWNPVPGMLFVRSHGTKRRNRLHGIQSVLVVNSQRINQNRGRIGCAIYLRHQSGIGSSISYSPGDQDNHQLIDPGTRVAAAP